MSYIMGFVVPVPDGNREAYVETARKAWQAFRDYGALEHVEAWGAEVPEGKQTDFRRAVDLKQGETVVFSWIIWPDKATAKACEAAMASDERFRAMDMPFDGKRMIWGGFDSVFAERA